MKIIAVVQARMGSTRLPGKSLAKVYKDYSLIKLVLLRVLKAYRIDRVVLATSENRDCDPLATLAEELGVDVVRGSEEDVLSRFVKAVERHKPDAVVRICADNPLVSPEELDKLVDFFVAGEYDYAENKSPECGLPDGLGAEIVTSSMLFESAQYATDEQKEHVTQYITDNPERFRAGTLQAEKKVWAPDVKLDIDTPEDLAKIRTFSMTLSEEHAPYWSSQEIIKNYRTHDCSHTTT